ncbi:MAG: RHS repeat-associated core domain-containing protein [Rhodocyclaceae bacterium]
MSEAYWAARLDDPLTHTTWQSDVIGVLVQGATYAAVAAGAAVAAAVTLTVGTGGAAAGALVAGSTLAARLIAPAVVGATLGDEISSMGDSVGDFFSPPTEQAWIRTGSADTHTNSKLAARAAGVFHHDVELAEPEPDERGFFDRTADAVAGFFTLEGLSSFTSELWKPTVASADPRSEPRDLDKIECSKHSPEQYLAQGSKLVFINSQPAVRSGALSTCEGKVIDTPPKVSPDVRIGGELVTVRDVRSGKAPIGLIFSAAMLVLRPCKIISKLPCMIASAAAAGMVSSAVSQAVSSGNPVHLATGAKTLGGDEDLDFILPGRLPIEWQRTYNSRDPRTDGLFGAGWSVPFEVALRIEPREGDEYAVYLDEQGRELEIGHLAPGDGLYSPGEGLGIRRSAEGIWTIEDESGLIRVFEPISPTQQRLRVLTDRNGNRLVLHYDDQARLTAVTDDDQAAAIVLYYDEPAHPRRLSYIEQVGEGDQRRVLVRYHYDACGDLATVIDPLEHPQRRFAYDSGRRMVEHHLPDGLACHYRWQCLTGPDGPEWRVTEHWTETQGEAHERWQFDYDLGAGRTTVRDGLGRVSAREWNPQYQITAHTDAMGDTWRFDWDDERLLLGATDPQGGQWRYTYDAHGRELTETDPLGRTRKTEWLAHWALPVLEHDAAGRPTRHLYDASGNRIAVVDPLGQRTTYAYDRHGQPVRVRDARGGIVQLRWSARGQLTDHIDCSGKRTQCFYNGFGTLTQLTDAMGQRTHYRHDGAGRLIETELPDGRIERIERTPSGRPAVLIDPSGARTALAWRPTGQLAARTDALGQRLVFHYDDYGRLSALTNENGQRYHFAWDAADRLTEQTDLGGLTQRYRYNALGLPIEVAWQPADGSPALVHALTRDGLGRLSAKHTPDGITRYTWSDADLVTAVDRHANETDPPLDTLRFDYDRLDRLTAEHGPHGSLTHAYDALGNRIATTLPDGRTINHLYYGSGHLHQINLDGAVVADYERDGLHREVRRSQGGLELITAWDQTGRLTRRAWRRHGTPAAFAPEFEKRYDYDPADNLVRELRVHSRPDNRWQRHTHDSQLHYDALGRITGAELGHLVERFAWDAASNLTDPERPGLVQDNRVRVLGDLRYDYDRFGRIETKRIGSHTVQTYAYDAEQRLTEVHVRRSTHPLTVRFTYDALGRRIGKTVFDGEGTPGQAHASHTAFTWDGMRLAVEHTKGQPQRLYFYTDPNRYEALACLDGNDLDQLVHLQADPSGRPEEATDADGNIVWQARFKVWGNTVQEHWTGCLQSPVNLRFQGQYLDRETGLHYNTFRYYDPDIGRFTQPDPIGLNGGVNLYQYAPNPTGWVDPWGWCRRGNAATKTHMDGVRDRMLAENPNMRHQWGGRDRTNGTELPETYLKPLGGTGRRGSSYTDMTFRDAQGRTVYVQTVDKGNVHGMSQREWNNAVRISQQDPSAIVITVQKGSMPAPGTLNTTGMNPGIVIR